MDDRIEIKVPRLTKKQQEELAAKQYANALWKKRQQLIKAWIAETGIPATKAEIATSKEGFIYIRPKSHYELALSNVDEIIGLVSQAQKDLRAGRVTEAKRALARIRKLVS